MSETKADVETAKEYGIKVNEQAGAFLAWLASAKKMSADEYAQEIVLDFLQDSLSQLSGAESSEFLGIKTEDATEEGGSEVERTIGIRCQVIGCQESGGQYGLTIRFPLNSDSFGAFIKQQQEILVPLCQAHAENYAGSNDVSSKIESAYLLDGQKGNV